jgi:hypothetical protein
VCEKMCSVIAPRISGFVDDARKDYNMCRCVTRFVFPTGLFALGMSSSRSPRGEMQYNGSLCVCVTQTPLLLSQKTLAFISPSAPILPIKVMINRPGMSCGCERAAITRCGHCARWFHRRGLIVYESACNRSEKCAMVKYGLRCTT